MNKREETKSADHDEMNDWMEFESSSKEETLEKACNALNTTRAYLEFETINKKGTKIKARKSETPQATAPIDNDFETEDDFDEDFDEVAAPGNRIDEAPSHAKVKTEESGKGKLRPKGKNNRGRGRDENRQSNRNDSRNNNQSDNRNGNYANKQEAQERRPRRHSEDERPKKAREINFEEKPFVQIDATELGTQAKETLVEIISRISDAASVELRESEDEICLDIQGDTTGILIGKHGQTLEAFQHIVAKILGLDRNTKKRLTLDAEGYRLRRQESLQILAERMADKAKRSRRTVHLEPMSAMDRRVIHMALADFAGIETRSVGEGMGRKVAILSKNARGERSSGRSENRDDRGRGNDRNEDRAPRRDRDEKRGTSPRKGRKAGKPKLVNGKNDSFDTPPAPSMDRFPDDIDDLADLPEEELHARLNAINEAAEDVKPKLITSVAELDEATPKKSS